MRASITITNSKLKTVNNPVKAIMALPSTVSRVSVREINIIIIDCVCPQCPVRAQYNSVQEIQTITIYSV